MSLYYYVGTLSLTLRISSRKRRRVIHTGSLRHSVSFYCMEYELTALFIRAPFFSPNVQKARHQSGLELLKCKLHYPRDITRSKLIIHFISLNFVYTKLTQENNNYSVKSNGWKFSLICAAIAVSSSLLTEQCLQSTLSGAASKSGEHRTSLHTHTHTEQ